MFRTKSPILSHPLICENNVTNIFNFEFVKWGYPSVNNSIIGRLTRGEY
nr:MAG TPA: hypothetical protein [Caudoviricetes sp.]